MHPKVSIILPNFNHQLFLKERLDSIFNQTFQDFEVIVLDDASTDGSMIILNEYKNHPKVFQFIINKKNSGSPFKQWKKGMQLARGEYIWIAETDDYADENFLETQTNKINSNVAIVAKTITVDGTIVTKNEVFHPIFKNNTSICTLNGNDFFTSPIKNVSCIIFKKPSEEELENMNFDIYFYMGDQVFYYQYFKNKTISFNPDTKSYYRKSTSSVSSINPKKGINYFKKYFDEHVQFAKFIELEMGRQKKIQYLKKHYRKIKNRTSVSQRINLKYLSIAINYYLETI